MMHTKQLRKCYEHFNTKNTTFDAFWWAFVEISAIGVIFCNLPFFSIPRFTGTWEIFHLCSLLPKEVCS